MDIWRVLVAVYLVVAMIFIVMTMREATQKNNYSFGSVPLGILGCLFWPITLVLAFLS